MAFIPYGQPGLAGALAMMQPPGGAPPQQQFQAQQQLPQPMQPPAAGYVDPSTIQRRQQLADMLRANAQRGGNPRTGMEAIGNLAQTLSAAFIDRKANKASEQNAAYRQSTLAAAMAEQDPILRAQKLMAAQDPDLQNFGMSRSFANEDAKAASELEQSRYQRSRDDRIADREDQQSFNAQMQADQRRYQQQSAAEQRAFQAEQNRLALEAKANDPAGQQRVARDQFNQEQRLRTTYDGLTKEIREAKRYVDIIKSSAALKNSQGDLALIVGFTKLLDPGTAAREGEVKLTQSTAGLLENASVWLPRLQSGKTLLPDDVRQKYVQAAQAMSGEYDKGLGRITQKYKDMATRQGLDPRNVVISYDDGAQQQKPAQDASGWNDAKERRYQELIRKQQGRE